MLPLILGVTALLSLIMGLAWVVQRRLGNAGWVDAVWSFGLGLAGVIYALAPISGAVGWPTARQTLLAILIAAWSARLAGYLFLRTRGQPEDARYAGFRKDWAPNFESRMFWFLQIQAAAAAILSLTMLLAARNPRPLGLADLPGLAGLAIAVIGEGIADAQLRRFRSDAANRGRVCDHGLWRLSRHPNYFFDGLAWLAYALLAIDFSGNYPIGWLSLLGPAIMYWLLAHVSGVPPLEAHMLKSRGDAYRRYQARTRSFFPLPLWSKP